MGELNLDSIEERCMREGSIDWQTAKALITEVRSLRRQVGALLYTGLPDGWKPVPAEPTIGMLAAAQEAWLRDPARKTSTLYRAAIAAAPRLPRSTT